MLQIWLKGKKIRLSSKCRWLIPQSSSSSLSEVWEVLRRSLRRMNVVHCVRGPSQTEPRQTEPVRAVLQLQAGRRQAGRLWTKVKPRSSTDWCCSNRTHLSAQMRLRLLLLLLLLPPTTTTMMLITTFQMLHDFWNKVYRQQQKCVAQK